MPIHIVAKFDSTTAIDFDEASSFTSLFLMFRYILWGHFIFQHLLHIFHQFHLISLSVPSSIFISSF